MEYAAFLDGKTQLGDESGFTPEWVPDFLFDFQRHLVEWSVRMGRAAIFADCGLGKTPMQLAWAENVHRHTNRPVLLITPLAVAAQTVEEAAKFGLEVRRSNDGTVHPGLNVTNYDRLHHFNPSNFGGVACDESSAIKSFDGERRALVTDFMRKMPYRLLSTATAAPNDYIELGTSSEALGQLGHMDMLNRFFRNTQNTSDTNRKWRAQGGKGDKWRFKGHAERAFWRWVCSWARAMRRPSDLGFDDTRFVLPTLHTNQHLVTPRKVREGWLFDMPASGLAEEREEVRRTLEERCAMAADLVNGSTEQSIVWCHLNDEGATLRRLIPDAVEVAGSDSVEDKEQRLMDFAHGQSRVLICKPKIGAWGLNLQNCAHVVYFPSHSFEQYYQAVRRCWRFGQTREVTVDIVTTPGGQDTMRNLEAKAKRADRMFTALVAEMHNAVRIARTDTYTTTPEIPSWLLPNKS